MNSSTSGWLVLTRNFVAGSHPQNDTSVEKLLPPIPLDLVQVAEEDAVAMLPPPGDLRPTVPELGAQGPSHNKQEISEGGLRSQVPIVECGDVTPMTPVMISGAPRRMLGTAH
jgi:hypothetical protein